ncbi:MAG TPA: SET domain-containing protein-lysine N-methyltransferase [Jatrophihabitantaceae bacterium]|nr:SET domain-containing protein-lysine N-methyltransferase [Jatrophihabitantaceae bacterium]
MTRAPATECWLSDDVTVGRSSIAGQGLFATASILQGTVVSRLGGRLVSTAELRHLMAGPDYVDSVAVDEDLHLLLAPGNLNRFGNHSCEPTLWWADEYTLVARRDLVAGEELTSDYSTSTTDPQFVLRCHCETYRCRQMVTGDDWRIPQLQQAYATHWTPYLQKLIQAL